MTIGEHLSCPLCDKTAPTPYHQDRWRTYWRCKGCRLVFVPPGARPDPSLEKARYDLHQNDPRDPNYRRFLARVTDPLLTKISPGAVGLDFGSGPGPTLDKMLAEAGVTTYRYDPLYAADPDVWRRRYDFITATEVIEHLHAPQLELARLFSALGSHGVLAVMTQWVEARRRFVASRYIRDPTHVCFYSAATCRWIAHRWEVRLEIPESGVALFCK